MAADPTSFASPETAAFWKILSDVLDRFSDVMSDLSVDELNWRPDAEGANTIYVLATHTLGNVRWTVREIIGGEQVHRDRESEFQSVATESNVPIPTGTALRDDLERAMVELPAASLDTIYPHPIFGDSSGRAVLHSMIRHAAEHLGHAGVTRDLILANRSAAS